MSENQPPPDMPNFESLGHEQTRAIRVWFFLRTHHGIWYTVTKISENLGLAESTVSNALSRIFGLPRIMRPFLERRIIENDAGVIKEYRCIGILEIITE